ncbi:MAG: hypothetical protein IJX80_02760 [Clostridia bacterium]|nr:hypothetical protein [Clostridia bacterium]
MFKEPSQMIALKENYQSEVAYTEETLRSWKRREGARTFFRALTVLLLLAGIAVAVLVWYMNRNADGYNAYIYAGIALCCTVIVLIINGIIRYALSGACRKAYDKYQKSDVRSQRLFDQVKREKVDPILENQIVINVHSTLLTHATYVYEDRKNKFADDFGAETVSSREKKNNPPRLWEGPVSAATAFIDDIEVGAIDVSKDSPFTTFRVNPGLHTLKLKIRRDYVDLDKSLEITTPALPFSVNGDYHIVRYILNATLNERGTLRYTLKTSEYDDMVTYIRDLCNVTEQLDPNKTELTPKLQRRAAVLYAELHPDEETEEEFLERELNTYGPEALVMGDVAKRLEASGMDARFKHDNRIEIVATLKRDKGDQ